MVYYVTEGIAMIVLLVSPGLMSIIFFVELFMWLLNVSYNVAIIIQRENAYFSS